MSTFLPSKGRSITTLGTRWHDFFFITLFRYFTIVLFFTLHFFSFSQGMQTRERAHCTRSVFPFIKKKKIITLDICIICQFAALLPLVTSQAWLRSDVLEPQPGYNYWRKPYVSGSGCSGPVSSRSFRFPP